MAAERRIGSRLVQQGQGYLVPPANYRTDGAMSSFYHYMRAYQATVHPERPPPIHNDALEVMESEDAYRRRMHLDNFEIQALMGRGSFGIVYKAKMLNSKEMIALKQLENFSPTHLSEYWKERNILIRFRHRRIVNLVGSFVEGHIFLAMELCYGSLFEFHPGLSTPTRVKFIIQLAEGLKFIHDQGIIHADIKFQNLLISTSSNLVLGDFGSALILDAGHDVIQMTRSVGTAFNQDSSANLRHVYSTASDMFSFACVAFELLTGKGLLRYYFHTELMITAEEYARAFDEGRLDGLTPQNRDDAGLPRIPLSTRVKLGAPFIENLKRCLLPHDKRLTAEEFLTSGELAFSLVQNKLDTLTFDQGGEKVATDFRVRSPVQFKRPEVTNMTLANRMELVGFYFDQKDFNGSQRQVVAIGNYDAVAIAQHLVQAKVANRFVNALANRDTSDLAQLVNLVETALDRKRIETGVPLLVDLARSDEEEHLRTERVNQDESHSNEEEALHHSAGEIIVENQQHNREDVAVSIATSQVEPPATVPDHVAAVPPAVVETIASNIPSSSASLEGIDNHEKETTCSSSRIVKESLFKVPSPPSRRPPHQSVTSTRESTLSGSLVVSIPLSEISRESDQELRTSNNEENLSSQLSKPQMPDKDIPLQERSPPSKSRSASAASDTLTLRTNPSAVIPEVSISPAQKGKKNHREPKQGSSGHRHHSDRVESASSSASASAKKSSSGGHSKESGRTENGSEKKEEEDCSSNNRAERDSDSGRSKSDRTRSKSESSRSKSENIKEGGHNHRDSKSKMRDRATSEERTSGRKGKKSKKGKKRTAPEAPSAQPSKRPNSETRKKIKLSQVVKIPGPVYNCQFCGHGPLEFKECFEHQKTCTSKKTFESEQKD